MSYVKIWLLIVGSVRSYAFLEPASILETLFVSSRDCNKIIRIPNYANVIFLGNVNISKFTPWRTFWYSLGGSWMEAGYFLVSASTRAASLKLMPRTQDGN